MKYHSAWTEISGKVYVDYLDMNDRLAEKYPELKAKADLCGDYALDHCSLEQKREVFEELAQEKISALFRTDDPIKLNEATIDMSTYHS